MSLPHDAAFDSVDEYVNSLLNFVASNSLLRTLCGRVHILDFFTTENPDLYSRILPEEWRLYFSTKEPLRVLDLLMRERLETQDIPQSLLDYISVVRNHLLCRQPRQLRKSQLARHVVVGMNVKKVHEVGQFAHYIDSLAQGIPGITHLVDFGSGQNYLGRALASEPFYRNIIAIESKSHNSERAKDFDVKAKLATKQRLMRNKKTFRAGLDTTDPALTVQDEPPLNRIRYIEHSIQDGDLADIVAKVDHSSPNLMVMSLHSCGNLVHHGLRSLLMNPAVHAVAMVGCCYNLLTERLGPPTYKLPGLGNSSAMPEADTRPAANAFRWSRGDPHGFPMSQRLCDAKLRLNITSRMMAVQAPQNWGPEDSESFFVRHFYRALLQRVLLDREVIGPPHPDFEGGSPAGHSSGTPIVIGGLRKSCYKDFVSYVRGALAKLYDHVTMGAVFREKLAPESITDEEIARYEAQYQGRKKDLSIVWSLMAFSAGVIEAVIVTDRWLWLKEQKEVAEAWVEPVFDYALSPRNLVVVGVKGAHVTQGPHATRRA
ncbi:hypothetical protein K470DRAFT_213212 [Piedraia hortae CBS 480.64]|uniref:Methyltransferase domain-containing protein n=1 Tax=Piedraia hortae CBS 480.64 TaxID=1314780 RepID=A0A6A7C424_9PEZI|nr:hypothetical protein K470DRAFT_213212 [Piedraia hortae CBS 480.64]